MWTKRLTSVCLSHTHKKKTETTLRAVLYRLKLQDNSSLVGEVHQAAAMSPVDVVIVNTEEASKMVEMMNRNVAAFLSYVMLEWDMDESFIKTLLSKTVDPELVADIVNYMWDKKDITTMHAQR